MPSSLPAAAPQNKPKLLDQVRDVIRHFKWFGAQGPEINFESRSCIYGIELIWRRQRGADGVLIKIKIIVKFMEQIRNEFDRKLNNEVEIVGGARNAPVIAGHRASEQIGDTGAI